MNIHSRYRRIIDAYRNALMHIDSAACRAVDLRVETWGEKWITTQIGDFDALMTASEIAENFGLAKHDIRNWTRRYPELVPVRGKRGNANLYRIRDVMIFHAKNRDHDTIGA